jgi:hypothetical protein
MYRNECNALHGQEAWTPMPCGWFSYEILNPDMHMQSARAREIDAFSKSTIKQNGKSKDSVFQICF